MMGPVFFSQPDTQIVSNSGQVQLTEFLDDLSGRQIPGSPA
jgi:hypothetical protein